MYLLNIFKLKRRKGETIKSFSQRVKKKYPEIEKELNEIYLSYNSYKFRNSNLSKQKLIALCFKLSYYQIKVLNHIAIKNGKLNNIKLLKIKN